MNANEHARFQALHQRYLTELTLRGKSPKTIDLYTRCLRQVSDYFETCPHRQTPQGSVPEPDHRQCRQPLDAGPCALRQGPQGQVFLLLQNLHTPPPCG